MKRALLSKKIKIIFKDNRNVLLILFFWFLLGFIVYSSILKLGAMQALKASFFFQRMDDDFSSAYLVWSQGIVFGVIFSILFQNILQKYNPERGCRMIAKEMENHFVVVGYSHLGERLVNHFKQNKIPYCLIDRDREAIDDLLAEGEPIIVDNAVELDALRDCNIEKAKAVIIASNNLETALIVTKRARERNKDCRIITRCFREEFDEIIETLGANEVVSSSKNAFDDILSKLKI
jgi:hypothetical protein